MSQTKLSLSDIPEDGTKLTHRLLYRFADNVLGGQDFMPEVTELLNTLDGSKVDVFVHRRKDRNEGILELRCGSIRCEAPIALEDLTFINELAPFIAACAGPATTPETASPERLD